MFTKIPHWLKTFLTKAAAIPSDTKPLTVEICILKWAEVIPCNDGFNTADNVTEPGIMITMLGVQRSGIPCEICFGLSCEGAGQFAKGIMQSALDSAKQARDESWKSN